MQRSYRNNRVPDLRKNPRYREGIDLKYLSMRYFVPMMIMITILMIGVMMVSATPNSNYPVSI